MTRFGPLTPVLLSLLFVLGIAGCGDGVSDPPGPKPVALVEVTPPTSEIVVAETVQLTATPKDAAGNSLSSRSIAWTSSDQAVASVSPTGLVTGSGKGEATITATSEGKAGNAAFTVEFADFTPQQNTTLSGTVTYKEVNVPENVTVTLSGDLALTAEGAITIQGDLEGDCTALTITGAGDITLIGDITNRCSNSEAEGADITVVADGDLTVGGVWISSGNTELSNDPTLTDTDFDFSAQSVRASGQEQANAGGFCVARGSWFADPAEANSGRKQQNGTDGRDGKKWRMSCRGELQVTGGLDLRGQSGGQGGMGDHESADQANATGGDGGDGGRITMRATSNILFSGSNTVSGGNGGSGGDAWALGKENPDPVRAPGAIAKGGRGGDPGTPTVKAGGEIVIGPEALTLKVGALGDGGYAIALGADGVDATQRDGGAQRGGEAKAEGGHGGLALSKYFSARGSVTGAETVLVESPHSGHGGAAYSDGGKGGDGDEKDEDGEKGGDMTATGGGGGKNDVHDQTGKRIQKGGDGGAAIFGAFPAPPTAPLQINVPADRKGRGSGGAGFDGCSVVPFKVGGQGGAGGGVDGANGDGGPGKELGDPGSVQFHGVSNAGDGDDGIPHGDGGGAGGNGVAASSPPNHVEDSFLDGEDGNDCPIPPKYSSLHHIGGLLSADPWILARHVMLPGWTGDFLHSRGDIPGIPRSMDHTTIMELGATVVNVDVAGASILDFYFDCGDTGSYTFARCNTEGPMEPGEYIAVSIVLHGMIPGFSSKWYQYAVVFDQDGDESNNFRAREPFTRDGLDNADRLYDVIHDPVNGWVARSAFYEPVTDGVYAHTSKARVIADGNTIVVLIPKDEFEADLPKFRVTTFCHEGDFGLEKGPFSGDHQSKVGDSLLEVWPAGGTE